MPSLKTLLTANDLQALIQESRAHTAEKTLSPAALVAIEFATEIGDVKGELGVAVLLDNGDFGIKKNWAEAAKWFAKVAASTDQSKEAISIKLGAENRLGDLYHMGGFGLTKNSDEAFKWYSKAADQGYAPSQLFLSQLYSEGKDIKKDDAKAVEWCRKAAEQDFAPAESNLGYFYDNGQGVKQDHVQAAQWFQRAADKGLPEAQSNIGELYYLGLGVRKDFAEALKWYNKAAEKGEPTAKTWLAAQQGDPKAQYAQGKECETDKDYPPEEAYVWYSLAVKAGLNEASAARNEAAKHLAADLRAIADQRVQEWKPLSAQVIPVKN